jgi:hypothetical protein
MLFAFTSQLFFIKGGKKK